MKLLREAIRSTIMESSSIVDASVIKLMQQEDLIIVVDPYIPHGVHVWICNREDYDEEYGDVMDAVGQINAETIGKGTMQITLSEIDRGHQRKGIGALMYNVVLGACTNANIWLMPDRDSVSPKAVRIWNKWNSDHSTYEIEQTDEVTWDEKGYGAPEGFDPAEDYLLTQTKDDDFHQGSFQQLHAEFSDYSDNDPRAKSPDGLIKDWWYFFDEDYKSDFLGSSLTKRYKMRDAEGFMNKLKETGVLFFMGRTQ